MSQLCRRVCTHDGGLVAREGRRRLLSLPQVISRCWLSTTTKGQQQQQQRQQKKASPSTSSTSRKQPTSSVPPRKAASKASSLDEEEYYAVAAPGLEIYTAAELRKLGIRIDKRAGNNAGDALGLSGEDIGGGVPFIGGREALYRANLHLRTASRVLVRMGNFVATDFATLRKRAAELPWRRFLRPGQPVNLRVTCTKSKLYHSGAVAERVAGAIGDVLDKRPEIEKGEDTTAQLIVVRLLHDKCTVSIDSSGELLHRRGYRLETAKAPLRETLAAGVLMASGWDGKAPLIDPFCGSGTIPIEAAMLAAGIAPGRGRDFAFMQWPGFQQRVWDKQLGEGTTTPQAAMAELVGEAALQQPVSSPVPLIMGSDRDAGAAKITLANAARAGVADRLQVTQQAVSAIQPPADRLGWVVTNPPYGVRVSADKDLRNLYAQLGNVLRLQCPGWNVTILCGDKDLLRQTGLQLDTSLTLSNGGLRVVVAKGLVPG